MNGNKPKILIGTHDVAGILSGLKAGFETIGCEVTTFVKETNPLYNKQYDYEILRSITTKPFFKLFKNSALNKAIEFADYNIQNLKIKKHFSNLVEEHDVFIFIWQSLLKNHVDYPIIKLKNKKIVNVFVGSDIRHISSFQQEFGGNQSMWEKEFHLESINTKLTILRQAELYSDLILSVPDQSGLAIRPYDHLYLPFDAGKINFSVSENDTLKVIHAPSRTGIKGTAVIVKTIERLKNEGISFEFKLLSGIPNTEVINELSKADVLVDELYLHGPGMLSLEAMASGCAVATHTMSIYKDVFNPPVCNIDEENIYEQLRYLFTNKNYRLSLKMEGKKFVDDNNKPSKIAARILKKLNSEVITYDYLPNFFLDKYKLTKKHVINKQNLDLTQKIIFKYGISNETDIYRAIHEKLVQDMDKSTISKTPIWQ